jgi:hypothetical protein
VMAHAQKPDFIFRRNRRVHLNRRKRQFCRLLAAEVCASAVVMPDTPCSEVVRRVLATHFIRQFPLHFPTRASLCAITFQLDSTTRAEDTHRLSNRRTQQHKPQQRGIFWSTQYFVSSYPDIYVLSVQTFLWCGVPTWRLRTPNQWCPTRWPARRRNSASPIARQKYANL